MITKEQFTAATPNVQYTLVKLYGAFLLRRKAGKLIATLYQMNDFYAEVIYAPILKNKIFIRCYTVKGIDNYLDQIDISAVTNLLKERDGG
jgi:hypothetical protein